MVRTRGQPAAGGRIGETGLRAIGIGEADTRINLENSNKRLDNSLTLLMLSRRKVKLMRVSSSSGGQVVRTKRWVGNANGRTQYGIFFIWP